MGYRNLYAESDILDFIRSFWTDNGYGPSIRDIGDAMGHNSTNVTRHWLKKLRDKNRITWEPKTARSIREVQPQ